MRLAEYENYILIEDFFSPPIIAGFTKPTLKGVLPDDIYKVLAFLDKEISVSFLNQLHSARIHYLERPGVYDGDALFSQLKNNVLVVKTADCLPLFFSSSKLGVIGLVHMGWRSAKEKILENIKFDLSSFRTALGVGLRKCCYRVSDEFLSLPNLSSFLEERNGGLYFDPVSFTREGLAKKNLKEEVFDINICSFCSNKDFFSYRRDKTDSRTLSFILKI